ncbi:MAG: hypothetical protein E6K56_03345 [Ignavibacteria bacterium]|nr:MAG: hypothetical protein E6K56_03345 [Ignavibacteria bacterium]
MLLIPSLLAFALFFQVLRDRGLDWRRAMLAAAVVWATSVVGITEVLSVPRLLTRGAVAAFWLAICAATLLYHQRRKRRTQEPPLSDTRSGRESLDAQSKWLLAGAGIVMTLVATTALVAPPSTWDAMEYHLGRVVIWISQHSARFFTTPDYAQLILGPWAEYAMTHAYLLWGTDRFVNFVEVLSMVGSAIGVSIIAKMLGAAPRGQALAAVISATIPSGVLEASGPMNTYVVSFWITTTVVFLLSWNEHPNWPNTYYFGLSAGLALLTKGSAYVYLPALVATCWWMGTPSTRTRLVKRAAILALLILAINGPQYLRAYDLTGSPLGLPLPDAGPRLDFALAHISVRTALANTMRHISLHLCLPGDHFTSVTERALRSLIQGIGANPDDRGSIRQGDSFTMGHFSLHEVHAGNPFHLVLLGIAVALVLFRSGRDLIRRRSFWYSIGILSAFISFCTFVKWDLWAARQHLPIFVLGSALIGLVLERYCAPNVGTWAAIIALLFSLPFALSNRTRSLIPWSRVDDVYHSRAALYFSDGHQMIAPGNIAAAAEVDRLNCHDIAVDSYMPLPLSVLSASPKSFYVYPLFVLMHADGRTRRVWYTGVSNRSIRYADPWRHAAPCAVVCLDCATHREKWAAYNRPDRRASVFDYIVVFSADEQLPSPVAGLGSARTR